MFKKILIANRGEIAVRVIRACNEMGIEAIAVYSEADRRSLHLRLAKEARCLGPAPSSESYLRMDKILEAAKASGAEAIHPGYGFMSENAAFAEACADEGIVFVGPPADAITKMGSKLMARQIMMDAGVPVVPGTVEPVRDDEEALRIAREVGYPVMLKASSGGGGKGMRLVEREEDLLSALRNARSESLNAFGDDAVYIEKFVVKPRHVEIQIFGDSHGNYVHMNERDCSIQRRHQKVVEESPCPVLTPEVRQRMTEVAIKAARAVRYVGAGTVEFLLDADLNFYFLEMNTRLQVEHPVTEMLHGIDMVKAQIRVAAGEPLPFTQEDILPVGASIECRIYAEDPFMNFAPSPGAVKELREPSGPWVRVDGYAYRGWEVPIHYDSLIAKLVVWGRTREEAIQRMHRALSEYVISPLRTTIPFHLKVMENEAFLSGHYTTGFIAQEFPDFAPEDDSRHDDIAVMVALVAQEQARKEAAVSRSDDGPGQSWKGASPWRIAGRLGAFNRL